MANKREFTGVEADIVQFGVVSRTRGPKTALAELMRQFPGYNMACEGLAAWAAAFKWFAIAQEFPGLCVRSDSCALCCYHRVGDFRYWWVSDLQFMLQLAQNGFGSPETEYQGVEEHEYLSGCRWCSLAAIGGECKYNTNDASLSVWALAVHGQKMPDQPNPVREPFQDLLVDMLYYIAEYMGFGGEHRFVFDRSRQPTDEHPLWYDEDLSERFRGALA